MVTSIRGLLPRVLIGFCAEWWCPVFVVLVPAGSGWNLTTPPDEVILAICRQLSNQELLARKQMRQ